MYSKLLDLDTPLETHRHISVIVISVIVVDQDRRVNDKIGEKVYSKIPNSGIQYRRSPGHKNIQVLKMILKICFFIWQLSNTMTTFNFRNWKISEDGEHPRASCSGDDLFLFMALDAFARHKKKGKDISLHYGLHKDSVNIQPGYQYVRGNHSDFIKYVKSSGYWADGEGIIQGYCDLPWGGIYIYDREGDRQKYGFEVDEEKLLVNVWMT